MTGAESALSNTYLTPALFIELYSAPYPVRVLRWIGALVGVLGLVVGGWFYVRAGRNNKPLAQPLFQASSSSSAAGPFS